MYKSPIEVLSQSLKLEIEKGVYKAVENYSINVDKDELIKALQYDRNQYRKGYNDAVREFTERLKDHFSTDIMLITQERYIVDNAVDNIANELLGGDY